MANSARDAHRRQEFLLFFDLIRLFLLNPANLKNDAFRQFAEENYNLLQKMIREVQQARSYTDVVLFHPEYEDVIYGLECMTKDDEWIKQTNKAKEDAQLSLEL